MAKLTLVQVIRVLEDADLVVVPRLKNGKPAVTVTATGADGKRCFLNRDIIGRNDETGKAVFGWTVGNEMVAKTAPKLAVTA